MISDLLTLLITDWSTELQRVGVGLQQPLAALKVGGARAKARKVNFLVFNSEQNSPVLLLKLPRSRWYESRLRNEYRALCDLAHLQGISGTAPRALGLMEYRSHVVLMEECLPGIPLKNLLRRHQRNTMEEAHKDLSIALNWLHQFQQETWKDTRVFHGAESVRSAFEVVEHIYPDFALPVDFIESLCLIAQEFQGLEISRTGCHGDFWPGNCLMDGSRISIIDWEHFSEAQFPFTDAFVFLTTYARTYPWKGWHWGTRQVAFRRSFLENNWLSLAVKTAAQDYFRMIQIPERSMHLFYSLFLAEMSCSSSDLDRDEQQANRWFELLNLYAENWTRSILL